MTLKQDLINVLGIDDESQAELYQDVFQYAQKQYHDILESGASEELKQSVEAEYKLVDEKLSGVLDFFQHHKLSDFVLANLKKEGLSDEDIQYVLDMLSDETYIRFMASYNASVYAYRDMVVGLIDLGVETSEQAKSDTVDTLKTH